MSRNNLTICLLLSAVLVLPGRSYGQWQSMEKKLSQSIERLTQSIDTSEYVPMHFYNALDINLMIAASKGYSSEVIRLIKMGADVDAVTDQGVTPLILAVLGFKAQTVSTILSFEPDIDKFTAYNENALLIAVKNNYFEISEILIRAGANINIGDRYNATPLHYASIYGYSDLADMLIYYDADLNARTSDGSTPLLGTVWAGNITIADLLIQNGSKVEEKNNEGFTPFLLSAYFGDTLMMDLLYKHGADIFARTDKGYNAMSLAIMSDMQEAVRYLLSLDKNWTGEERSVTDPYTVAAKYQHSDVIELLKQNNVPGKVKYEIDQVALSLSSRFSFRDFYSGASLTFKEPLLNAGFIAGIDTKLWYTRVLMKQSEGLLYQYWDKGSVAYAGIFKDFIINRNPNKLTTAFSTSLLAGYSFGNDLKGTRIKPESNLKIIPSAAFRWTFSNLTIIAGMEYIKTDFHRNGPLWFRIGAGYNYYFDNIRTRIKFPKWY